MVKINARLAEEIAHKRAREGKISVEKIKCPKCSHLKAFSYIGGRIRCCRCGNENYKEASKNV